MNDNPVSSLDKIHEQVVLTNQNGKFGLQLIVTFNPDAMQMDQGVIPETLKIKGRYTLI